jgi:hypothetical protein
MHIEIKINIFNEKKEKLSSLRLPLPCSKNQQCVFRERTFFEDITTNLSCCDDYFMKIFIHLSLLCVGSDSAVDMTGAQI